MFEIFFASIRNFFAVIGFFFVTMKNFFVTIDFQNGVFWPISGPMKILYP